MKALIIGGMAAGAITVLFCTSHIGEMVRRIAERLHPVAGQLANCCFCTSWWVSIAMLEKFSLVEWAATVAIANFTVLLIHLGIATVGEEEDNVQEIDSMVQRPATAVAVHESVQESH